jgi:S-adenosylmethionine-diacylglycerol 3-amino-3-carboxypropyl transferase|tara:strand:- start:9 stop:1085 length:1077 start_codon:yes stop_codon:yes gene_type:complete
MKNDILYSLCWEDPTILLRALKIVKNGIVLSIASGGENVFSILLKNPAKIVAIDNNSYQIYLVKLKIAAIKALGFQEFIQFLGFNSSASRIQSFEKCKNYLSKEELNYWENNTKIINNGIAHCGKFEAYLNKFRKYVLPLVLSKKQIKKYLSLQSIKNQEIFFDNRWNNWKWKFLFNIFFSRTLMQLLGRRRAYFKYNIKKSVAKHFFNRSKYGLTKIPVYENYFIYYILAGSIPVPFKHHPYLDEKSFYKLKKLVGKIELVHSNVLSYLKKSKNDTFTKYNLSDIFELTSQIEYESIIKEVVRTSKKRGIVCYWNNLVPRYSHPTVKGIVTNNKLSDDLFKKDRVFFYSKFIVEEIK